VPRISLVVPGLALGGGVPVVARFLFRALAESGRHEPRLISLAMDSRDPAGVRLLSPITWWRGVRIERGEWEGLPFEHVGAWWSEVEAQRYRPRRALTDLLEATALVQVVAGSPAWAWATRRVARPVALQVATLVREERKAQLARSSGMLGRWRALMSRLTARLDARALAHVDAVFVENDWMRAWMLERLPPSRVIFAPPGVDTELFRPADPRPEGGYVLSVGRFSDPRKRVDLLFRSYARLRQILPGAPRLVLAGSAGPPAADWEVARSLGIAEHVDVHEMPPTAELAAIYRRASLFVLSSDEEGLGLVILEAMASGLPVVATDCGGPSTSVVHGQTGFIVPRDDPEALAASMAGALRDAGRARAMGQAGRSRACERFSHRATARLFLDYYDRRLLGR
jgi:glycosyltransferase involved in cell wall biosynthesis